MILVIKIHNWLGVVATPLILTLGTLEAEAGRFCESEVSSFFMLSFRLARAIS